VAPDTFLTNLCFRAHRETHDSRPDCRETGRDHKTRAVPRLALYCYFGVVGVARLAAAASGTCSLQVKVVLCACCLRQFPWLERLIDDFDPEAIF
jgi:hypothetical protein